MALEIGNNVYDFQNVLKIYNIKDKQEYLREVAELTQKEWGSITTS